LKEAVAIEKGELKPVRNLYAAVFLLPEILLALPLLLYAGLRLRRFLDRPLWKNIWTVIFLALLGAYPLADSLAHGSLGGAPPAVLAVGYDALPWALYFLLTVVLTDLVLWGMRAAGIVSREWLQLRGIRLARFWTMAGLPALIVLGGIANFTHLRVSAYTIDVPRKQSKLDHLRIVFASDFHLGDLTAPGFMPDFVARVNALNPDLVLIGGDVIEGDRRGEAAEAFTSQFRRLRATWGVFGVLGNHEGFGGGNRDAFFGQAGITLLKDEVREVDGAFRIAGRLDPGLGGQRPRRKSAAELFAAVPDDLPLIVIDHRPTDLDAISQTATDIQFSGHTHAGQLFPVNFITSRQYELMWGELKKRNTNFFVSSGVQLWGPRVRTVGVSEIVLVDVRFRQAAR
jgi:predicted MPP superfamily phosphohydrolase